NFFIDEFYNELILSRLLLHDPDTSVLVKIHYENDVDTHFTVQDYGFIHIPKPIKKYESKPDIMGIDLGSTRCVLAVSRNREIQVIPIDSSSLGDLWTESIISFDEEEPIIGKAAM